MQKLVAMWNTARGVWEKPETIGLLCEHSELFLETWPTSGTMRNGTAWEHQRPEHVTNDSVSSSLLRTPTASEAERGHQDLETIKKRGGQVTLTSQVRNLPTPRASQGQNRNSQIWHRSDERMAACNLETALYPVVADRKLPTPTVADTFTGSLKSTQQKEGSMHSVNLSQAINLDWGQFAQSVGRWEQIVNRVPPVPGFHHESKKHAQLNPKFTEWMMGLKDGWITGHGLGRLEELKMAGNGVVPQQAKLALEILINRYDKSGGED